MWNCWSKGKYLHWGPARNSLWNDTDTVIGIQKIILSGDTTFIEEEERSFCFAILDLFLDTIRDPDLERINTWWIYRTYFPLTYRLVVVRMLWTRRTSSWASSLNGTIDSLVYFAFLKSSTVGHPIVLVFVDVLGAYALWVYMYIDISLTENSTTFRLGPHRNLAIIHYMKRCSYRLAVLVSSWVVGGR